MPRETEVKFKVSSHAGVRRALRKAGAAYLQTVLQTDTFYDTADNTLQNGDRGLRIRESRVLRSARAECDARPLLTYKGPRGIGADAKVRQELQTHFDDAGSVRKIMRLFGMCPVKTIQKRRATYRLGRCLVELDELPIIGCFVEIEAASAAAIERARAKLAINGPGITRTYLDLLDEACGRKGRSTRDIRFRRIAGRRG